MSMSSDEESLVPRYVEAAGARDGGRYVLSLEELAWALRTAFQSNALRLELLTALQRVLPQPKGQDPSPQSGLVSDLKEVLTNVIIMQTRLKEREESLVRLLEQAVEQGAVRDIAVSAEDVRQWAQGILEAYQHLRERGSEPGQ